MRFLLKLNAAFCLVFMFGLVQPALATSGGETSRFQRLKSGTGKFFGKAKSKTGAFFGKAKTGTANTLLACGTDCANGKQSIQALVSCAYTHPRVPKCMRGMEKELAALKKNFNATYQIDDEDADASKLVKTYFALNPVSREMAFQMAQARVAHEKSEEFKKGNLFVLKRYYKKAIMPHFFVENGHYYTPMMKNVETHHAQHAHIGYLFHVDPVAVQHRGGTRMVHGVILHTPTAEENHTGLIFEVPLKDIKGKIEKPIGKFVYFSRVSDKIKQEAFDLKMKGKLRTVKHKVSVNKHVTTIHELNDKPPVDRGSKPQSQSTLV